MMKLFQIELLKFRNSRAFWGIFAIYALCVFVAEMLVSTVGITTVSMFLGPKAIWYIFGYIFKFFCLFLGIIIITNMTSEYSNRTMRQHIVDGLSREQFFGSKSILIMSIGAIATVFAFLSIIPFAMGSIAGGTGVFSAAPEFLIAFFLYTLGVGSIALLSALIFRNTGLAISAFFGYLVLELIVWGFLASQLGKSGNASLAYNIHNYFPNGSFLSLFPNPWLKEGGNLLKTDFGTTSRFVSFTVAIVYLAILSGLNYYLIRKKDLK